MLKTQLARALQLPMDTRAEQGLDLLRELEEPGDAAPDLRAAEERDCDRVIAMLRARLAAR
jgi:hypothetical protein